MQEEIAQWLLIALALALVLFGLSLAVRFKQAESRKEESASLGPLTVHSTVPGFSLTALGVCVLLVALVWGAFDKNGRAPEASGQAAPDAPANPSMSGATSRAGEATADATAPPTSSLTTASDGTSTQATDYEVVVRPGDSLDLDRGALRTASTPTADLLLTDSGAGIYTSIGTLLVIDADVSSAEACRQAVESGVPTGGVDPALLESGVTACVMTNGQQLAGVTFLPQNSDGTIPVQWRIWT